VAPASEAVRFRMLITVDAMAGHTEKRTKTESPSCIT